MRMRTLLASLLLLAACGGDDGPEKVRVQVDCTFVCDGETTTASETECNEFDVILDEIEQIVADCEAQFADCQSYSCECLYDQDPPSCD